MRQKSGSTLPAKRKSSVTAKDSMTMRASTSIAAPRLNAGGERWKTLCNRSTGPRSLSPILFKSHIVLHSNFYGWIRPLAYQLRKCRKQGAARQCERDAHEGQGVSPGDQQRGETGDDACPVVEIARTPVHPRGRGDPLVDVLPVRQEDALPSPASQPPNQRICGVEEVRREDHHASQEAQRRQLLPRERGRVEGCRCQAEAEEVGSRIPDKDGCRVYVPDQEPRSSPDERGQETTRRSHERREEERVDERDATRKTVYAVHEVEGVAQGHDPEHPDDENQGAKHPGSVREDRRRIEQQQSHGGQNLEDGLHAEVEVGQVVG